MTINVHALSSIGAFAASALQVAKHVKNQGFDDQHYVSLVVSQMQELVSPTAVAQPQQILGGHTIDAGTALSAQMFAQQNSGRGGNAIG